MAKILKCSKLTDCPEDLTGEARKEWERILPEVMKRGFHPVLDRAALKAYCITWGSHVEAQEEIARTVDTRNRDQLKRLSMDCYRQACALLEEFGIEPDDYIPGGIDRRTYVR